MINKSILFYYVSYFYKTELYKIVLISFNNLLNINQFLIIRTF
jgi:hypothetical protein